jgi:hypothetical protein
MSIIKTSQLMLYREMIAVCSQIHTKHIPECSLARPTSPCILFDGEDISFDASLVLYI